MKKLFIVAFLLTACSNNRNELMTKLINEKKIADDSFQLAKKRFKYFSDEYINSKDSNNHLIDSFVFWATKDSILNRKVKSLAFSIDSLQKMK